MKHFTWYALRGKRAHKLVILLFQSQIFWPWTKFLASHWSKIITYTDELQINEIYQVINEIDFSCKLVLGKIRANLSWRMSLNNF